MADDGNRRILLLGGSGQIGSALRQELKQVGSVVAPGREELDLTQPNAVCSFVDRFAPRLIVNAAAYTKVDDAEHDRSTAMALNADTPGLLGHLARRQAVPLVHYSTDYVFDGRGERTADGQLRGYVETDSVGPLNVYGHSKLEGEQAIHASGCAHLILRTSWIFAGRGQNFLTTMRRLAAEGGEVAVVNDQLGCPTWARLVAQATTHILSRFWSPTGALSPGGISGTYHLACARSVSWFGFAQEILSILSQAGNRVPRLRAITTADYPAPAARPRYSVLDCTKARATFDVTLSDWRTALASCLAEDCEQDLE